MRFKEADDRQLYKGYLTRPTRGQKKAAKSCKTSEQAFLYISGLETSSKLSLIIFFFIPPLIRIVSIGILQ